MKIIINRCYGGYNINGKTIKKLSESGMVVDEHGGVYDSTRTNSELIKMIENGEYVDSSYSKLKVVEIPDNATDYMIEEYDGLESILYVVDGKINYIY